MYPKVTFYSFVMLGFFGVLWVFNMTFVRQKDIVAYTQFIESIQNIVSTKDTSATYQKRKGLRKDMWLSQDNHSRLHYRIDSASSILTLIPTDNKVDVLENLQGVQGWVQERLYMTGQTPMQQMRFFEAGEGTYQYTTQEFLAKSVALSLFRLPGHSLPLSFDINNAFLKGIAQDVSFSVSGKMPQFQAKRFQATLSTQTEEKP
jgi:hypothetical protein